MRESEWLRVFAAGLVLLPPITGAAFEFGMKNYDNCMLVAAMFVCTSMVLNKFEKQ